MGASRRTKKGRIGLRGAVAMAIGVMIGASIFAIFGVGARYAGRNLPEAFLISGLFAYLVAYSYVYLSRHIVSNAGPMAYLLHGIGDNLATGALSILFWFSYVISISLFARGLAGYLLPLIGLPATGIGVAISVIGVLGLLVVINFVGARLVGRAESLLVFLKVAILGTFIAVGLVNLQFGRLVPAWSSAELHGTLHASILLFLAYLGFGLITNASEDIVHPTRTVPRAIVLSIVIVLIIYVAVAVVAIGHLPAERLIQAQENALAIAAEPFLGQFGFFLISVGAVLSLTSAMNAALFGGANVAYSLAKDGELPALFTRKTWFKATEGLYLTAGLSALLAILFDLGGIASITSAFFLIIYICVAIAHYRLVGTVGGSRVVLIVNITVLTALLAALLYYQWLYHLTVLYGTLGIAGGSLILEIIYRGYTHRVLRNGYSPDHGGE